MIDRAGHVARDGVDRLVLAGEAVGAACIDQAQFAGMPSALCSALASSERLASGRATNSRGARSRIARVTGNPAALQAARPPSSTATRVCPSQRNSHQARAAYMPLPWS
jgi:hypothetical protein